MALRFLCRFAAQIFLMAKKNTPQPKSASAKPTAQPKGASKVSLAQMGWIPAAIGFLVFCAGLSNEMLGVDDHNATVNNPAVTGGDLFGTFNLGMYAPLTWIGYSLAYALGKESSLWYHLMSALVHAFNCYLVFRLVRRLDTAQMVALCVAAIFAIHPIQVESVAWIAGFSTPLYAMFYLLACLRYLNYTENPSKTSQYGLALLFFVLACLSKSAAVTLPLVLVLLDYWRKPALPDTRKWLGYAPFFLVAAGFGALTVYSREQAVIQSLVLSPPLSALERLWVIAYTPVLYWYKILLPFKLNIYYSFEKVDGQFPWPYWVAPFVLVGVLFAAWRARQSAPWAWWGLLFYFANLSVMLPFKSMGTFELCADHYNYLAIVGLAFLLVKGWGEVRRQFPDLTGLLALVAGAWGILLLGLCLRQIRIWKDTVTVVTHAIDNGCIQNGLMYSARGQAYGKLGKAALALKDFDAALKINPDIYEAYRYRGSLFGMAKQYENSVADLSKYLEKYPNESEQYYNRGLSLVSLNRMSEAIADFSKTISLNPNFARAYRARGNSYRQIGEIEKGDADLREWEKRKNDPQQ
jgi:hypothetical protein